MKLIIFLCFLVLISCSTVKQDKLLTTDLKGCVLLYNLRTEKFLRISGDHCHDRYPAFSTFKVPLSVMAFDTDVLKDEFQIFKWNGVKSSRSEADQDQDARSWMKNSIVWFSQQLTPKLGEKKIKQYLEKFDYGNRNIEAGLTDAWLISPGSDKPSLKISAFEQLEFMKKLWTDKLPVSERSMKLTRKITYLETSPNGFHLSGKTGSGFYDKEKNMQLGWFVAHVTNGKEHFLSVVTLSDTKPYTGDLYGGARAKDITKEVLKQSGLW